jgi:hypothetical protein
MSDDRILTEDEYEQLNCLFGRRSNRKHCSDHRFTTLVIETSDSNFRTDKMIVWCVDNITGSWSFGRSILGYGTCTFGFDEEIDAMAFKLKWG